MAKPTQRILRAAAALIACGAAAALGLAGVEKPLLADMQSDPLAGSFKKAPPVFPGARPSTVGSHLEVNGDPLALAQYVVKEPPDAIAEFYLKNWHDAGMETVKEKNAQHYAVSAFDLQSGVQQTAVFVRQGESTQVFVSETLRSGLVPQAAARDGAIPVPPDAWSVGEVRAKDFGRRSRQLAFFANGAPDGVARYYRDALIGKGWSDVNPEATASLEFRKGRVRMVVSMLSLPDANATSVSVTEMGDDQ